MTILFNNYEKKDADTITFDISDCNVSLVNGLRRTIITDVTTVGFDTIDYEKSDLKVITNTGVLHNQYLLHRIGMIPLNVVDIEGFATEKYTFILEKQNTPSQKIK